MLAPLYPTGRERLNHRTGEPLGRRAPVRAGAGLATRIVRALDGNGIEVDDIEIRQPSLDDVFFALTGHPAQDAGSAVAGEQPDRDDNTDAHQLEVTFT